MLNINVYLIFFIIEYLFGRTLGTWNILLVYFELKEDAKPIYF